MESNSESGKSKQTADRSYWPQLSLAAAGMISAIAGSNTPGFTWLLYLGAGIIVLALIIMVWNTLLGRITKEAIFRRRDRRLLAKYDDEYWSLLKTLSVLTDLSSELDRVNWHNHKPSGIPSAINTLSVIELQLRQLPKSARTISLNLAITQLIDTFDSWLYLCDQALQFGKADYKSEQDKNKTVRLLRKYEHIIEHHNQLCESINTKLYGLALREIYTHEHGFNWTTSLPNDAERNPDR